MKVKLPVRREILISTRFGDVPQVHRVSAPGADRTQLTFFPDRVTSAHYDPVAGKYFIFSKDIGGGEWFQYYRYDVDSGDITLLTDGKSRNLGAVFANRSGQFAYNSTRRNGQDTVVPVEIGLSGDTPTEIISGVQAGDQLLLRE